MAQSEKVIAYLASKHTSAIYAGVFATLIAVLTVAHFARLYMQLSHNSRGTLGKILAAPLRAYRRVFLRKLPKVTSGGHLLTIVVYCGLNAVLTFWDFNSLPGPKPPLLAKRCGWMSLDNAALAFLLGMKNTPLAFLTGYSYERLNVLHRWVGRTVWFFSTLHVITYCVYFRQYLGAEGAKEELTQSEQVYGFVAYAAFTVLIASSLHFIRKRFYEFFYMMHLVGFIIAVTFLGLHKPTKIVQAVYAMSAFWLFDRLVRTVRAAWYSYGNTATLIPLPGMATKVVLKRQINCTPGSHAFLAIPAIRSFQSHPFTISSVGDVEFIIKAQKQFTLDLHKYALQNPHAQVRAFLDGPYGAVPDFKRMNKVVLIAGGSGGTFLFPIAIEIARNASRCAATAVECIWVIRDERALVWHEDQIEELQRSPIVSLRIHVTSKTDPIVSGESAEAEAGAEETFRRSLYLDDDAIRSISGNASASSSDDAFKNPQVNSPGSSTTGDEDRVDLEKQISRASKRRSVIMEQKIDERSRLTIKTLGGRPDLTEIVKSVAGAADRHETVAVGACGPTELMRVARNAVAESITITGPSITLHCEQFGWG